MAITLVQSAHASGISGGNVSVTLGSNTTAGNCLVVVAYTEFANPTVTLTGSSDTFTLQAQAGDGATASNFIALYTDSGCSGGHSTVNVAFGSATAVYAIVYEFSGLYTTGVLDKTTNTNHSSPTTTSWSSGTTATTTVANELWFGAVVTSAHAPTGPTSPWVNAASGALSDSANVLTGYNIVSSTGGAAYAGTIGTADIYGALVVTLKGAVTSTGSASLNKMSMAGSETETESSTGSISLNKLSLAGSAFSAMPFPANILGIKVELFLNGTWTDITSSVYQRNPITITGRGRADETTSAQPSSMALTLDNRNGQFTPKNSDSVYYPYITRNTQIRLSVTTASATGNAYQGSRFYGEVSSWPPQWDPTGSDVYIQVTASGILRRLSQNTATLGTAMSRYMATLTDVNEPLGYWPAEDPTGSTQLASELPGGSAMTFTGSPSLASNSAFGGSSAIPTLNGSVWTGTPAMYSVTGTDSYTTPGTYTWSCPPSVTSVAVACWGGGASGGGGESQSSPGAYSAGGGGGGGEYAGETTNTVVPGDSYTVVVGAGGSGGTVTGGGNSSFSGPSATTVTAHGAPGNNNYVVPGTGGTGSTNSVHHDGGSGGTALDSGNAHAGGGGGGAGASAGAGGNGGNGTSGAGGTGGTSSGGDGGKGAYYLYPNSSDTPAKAGTVPGGGGGGGDGFAYGGNGASGTVSITYTPPSVPYANVLRFLLDVPSGGGTNGSTYMYAVTGGTIQYLFLLYGTGGTLQLQGYNGATLKFDSGAISAGINGTPKVVSVELTPSGSSVAWALKTILPGKGNSATTLASGTVASAIIGQVTSVEINHGGTETGSVAIGHVIVQHYVTSLPDLAYAASGYTGELAGDRFTRICTEGGVAYELVGNSSDTPAMGPQADDTFLNVLQAVENLDCGLIFESRDQFGLSYRTRVDMQNQSVVLPLDYSAAEIGSGSLALQPTYDDQYIRNDVTISRVNGSSARQASTSGSMSIQDPPNGVGDYAYSRSVDANTDSQLANEASWLLSLGTVDDERYPQIPLDLSRSELAGLFSKAAAMDVGDFVQITNMPTFMGETSTSQLAWGLSETLNAYTWQIIVNAVPEVPYEGVGLPTW